MLNKYMQDMKDFLLNRHGWELKEIIEDIIDETNLLKFIDTRTYKSGNTGEEIRLSDDECSIFWGASDSDDYVCGLDDFIQLYTEIFIKKICNVIDSYDTQEKEN